MLKIEIPCCSSDRIHPVSGADLLEQAWSHQRRLLLLLVQLLGPHQHQLPQIVVPLPLGRHMVPLQVALGEDGRPSRSVEGAMVDRGWGNTGPRLRGDFHHTTHTQSIPFYSLPRGTIWWVTWLEKRGQVNFVAEGQVLHQLDVVVADELGGGGGVQVGVVGLVAHPRVHHRRWGGLRVQTRVSRDAEIFTKAKILEHKSTCGSIQLLDLGFVSVNEELVQVVLGGGLVVVTPKNQQH